MIIKLQRTSKGFNLAFFPISSEIAILKNRGDLTLGLMITAQYGDPAKIFLTSKFSYLLFSNPTHGTKTGTTNRWETTNSNPPGPIKLSSQSIASVRLCCAFYQPQKIVQNHFADMSCRGPKHVMFWPSTWHVASSVLH